MKTAKDYLDEAHAVVPRMSAAEAVAEHGANNAIFIDVRDSSAIAATGTIAGALRIPRGVIEFAADETSPLHNPVMTRKSQIYLVCAVGGQAALAGKTLKDMGYDRIVNIGGISDWIAAGGAVED
jgi:rhodanese-related sulfurtransferase